MSTENVLWDYKNFIKVFKKRIRSLCSNFSFLYIILFLDS